MQTHFGLGLLRPEWKQSIACVGTFDGVHRGHQAVIGRAVEIAQMAELPCILVTFDRHPAAILAPARCPKALSGLQSNLHTFAVLGVSAAVVLPFDAELSRMSAERFLREILIGSIRATSIVIGHDFAMGNGREGNADWLGARIPTTVVPPFEVDGSRVSSSQIRSLVDEGDVETAAGLLGRRFALGGVVVGGAKLGRKLGYPTANLARSFDQAVPANGIYAAWAETAHGRYMASVSIGNRPTVGGGDRTIEAFLIDYPGDSLYGASLDVEFVKRLRDELNFATLEDLIHQIAADVVETRQVLSNPQVSAS
ncbi:MAG: bifunctional riboflavin kinase/FAD synthetase [Fimbriimonas sp.]|nr:bifunctional riboflavin kinase/FAD synthetase [Fimbriimonas sp.]